MFNQVCFIWDVARKHTSAEKFVVLVKRGHHRALLIGTSRSRVNLFMNKFMKLGFIEYNGGLLVNSSLLSVVLHD